MKHFESLKKVAPESHTPHPPQEAQRERERQRIREERRAALSSLLENERAPQLETRLCPKVGFLTDGEHIENQQVSIITMPDQSYKVSFKLTQSIKNKVLKQLQEEMGNSKNNIVYDHITFQHLSSEIDTDYEKNIYRLSKALKINFSNHSIKIATGTRYGNRINASHGLVEITIPNRGHPPTVDTVLSCVNQFMRSRLGIEESMDVPDVEATQEYKRNRYTWHHKLEDAPLGAEDKLTREEVFPGHYTFVEEGKYEEYMSISPYAVYRTQSTLHNLPNVIKSGGVTSSFERFNRGLVRHGMSSDQDMRTGGGVIVCSLES